MMPSKTRKRIHIELFDTEAAHSEEEDEEDEDEDEEDEGDLASFIDNASQYDNNTPLNAYNRSSQGESDSSYTSKDRKKMASHQSPSPSPSRFPPNTHNSTTKSHTK